MAQLRKLLGAALALIVLAAGLRAASGAWNGVAFTAWNGVAITSLNGTSISAASSGLLADETWAGTGAVYSWGTSLGAGSVYNPDDTSLGLGGDNLYLERTSSTTQIGLALSASSTVYIRITGFQFSSAGAANYSTLQLYSAGGTVLENSLSIRQTTPTARWTNKTDSSTYAQTTATYAANTLYDLYLTADASAGTCSVEMNANGTGRSGSGTDYAAQTGGDTGHQIDYLVFNLNNTLVLKVGRIEVYSQPPPGW